MLDDPAQSPQARAVCLIPRCVTLRVGAGMKVRELAVAAEVSIDTVRNIERNRPVSAVYAVRVLNALRTKTGQDLPAEEFIERLKS